MFTVIALGIDIFSVLYAFDKYSIKNGNEA